MKESLREVFHETIKRSVLIHVESTDEGEADKRTKELLDKFSDEDLAFLEAHLREEATKYRDLDISILLAAFLKMMLKEHELE